MKDSIRERWKRASWLWGPQKLKPYGVREPLLDIVSDQIKVPKRRMTKVVKWREMSLYKRLGGYLNR